MASNGRSFLTETARTIYFITADEIVLNNEHGVPRRMPVSGPMWEHDAELFNLEQVRAKLRVCGNDIKEANDRGRRDLISKSKGETNDQADDACFLISKGVLVKVPYCHVQRNELCAVCSGQFICLGERCGNVIPWQLTASDEAILAVDHISAKHDLVRMARKDERREKRTCRCVKMVQSSRRSGRRASKIMDGRRGRPNDIRTAIAGL
jgi:hypothetical protein